MNALELSPIGAALTVATALKRRSVCATLRAWPPPAQMPKTPIRSRPTNGRRFADDRTSDARTCGLAMVQEAVPGMRVRSNVGLSIDQQAKNNP
ncbi:hypothetical protein G7043_29800 [Lentzea sp. NEAU-D13]|uniref:Uncharacterized protein n=1 Tax=Lentzea alba TaxID=2714351 RepID=A0A7C9W085_9PSEU|nr:hypothetical protein [Lentzea alba]NGY63121.1 hypothetical protein [Lentzea alba]